MTAFQSIPVGQGRRALLREIIKDSGWLQKVTVLLRRGYGYHSSGPQLGNDK